MTKAAVAFMVVAAVSACASQARAYEQQSGSITIGLCGTFEGLAGAGRFGLRQASDFDHGFGYGMRLRYALSRQASIGLVFERQTFNWVGIDDPGITPLNDLLLIVTGGEYVRHFGRRGKTGEMVFGGFGFYHPTIETTSRNETEPMDQTDNVLGWLGGAIEYFPRRTIGVELGFRGFAIKDKGGTSGAAQASLGVNFYLLK